MANIALGLLILLAVILLVAIICVLGLWLKGVGSIAFPGLGIIVATGLILAFLIIMELVVIICAAFVIRSIPVFD
ncbi:MAG TPA: hypothetical protein VF735_01285 [Pyrinomonadaceae bacterium]|jgi:hypothetical protein